MRLARHDAVLFKRAKAGLRKKPGLLRRIKETFKISSRTAKRLADARRGCRRQRRCAAEEEVSRIAVVQGTPAPQLHFMA